MPGLQLDFSSDNFMGNSNKTMPNNKDPSTSWIFESSKRIMAA